MSGDRLEEHVAVELIQHDIAVALAAMYTAIDVNPMLIVTATAALHMPINK